MSSSERVKVEELKLLLDTTYLLPVVGISVENVDRVLKVLRTLYSQQRVALFYSPFSLLEIVGKLSKMSFDRKIVSLGLRSIREFFRPVQPTVMGYIKALDLRSRGFRDLIDLLLYATALSRGLTLLTRDESLVEFIESVGEDRSCIMLEKEFLELYGSSTNE